MNPNYTWQVKKDKYVKPTYYQQQIKTQRKQLNKKLKAIQTHPDRWIHEMDDEMFNTVCQMLRSQTETDIEMARDIIFKSKMSLKQISEFTLNEYMCSTILNGPSFFNTWSYGVVNVPNHYTTI
jgi:hypothetical protein